MTKRGKQGNPNYVSISGRIPLELRKAAKHKQIDTNMTTDEMLEHLLTLWVSGQAEPPKNRQKAPPPKTQNASPQNQPTMQELTGNTAPPAPKTTKPPKGSMRELVSASTPRFTEATELGKLRAELGMSQRKLASALGIHHSTVGDYERGQKDTPPEVLEQARALLGSKGEQ